MRVRDEPCEKWARGGAITSMFLGPHEMAHRVKVLAI